MKFKAHFLINEDPKVSKFAHSKLMAIEKISCLITTLIFFLSCCKTEMDILTGDPSKITSMYIMYTLSICTVALSIFSFIKYLWSPYVTSVYSSWKFIKTNPILKDCQTNGGSQPFYWNQTSSNFYYYKSSLFFHTPSRDFKTRPTNCSKHIISCFSTIPITMHCLLCWFWKYT